MELIRKCKLVGVAPCEPVRTTTSQHLETRTRLLRWSWPDDEVVMLSFRWGAIALKAPHEITLCVFNFTNPTPELHTFAWLLCVSWSFIDSTSKGNWGSCGIFFWILYLYDVKKNLTVVSNVKDIKILFHSHFTYFRIDTRTKQQSIFILHVRYVMCWGLMVWNRAFGIPTQANNVMAVFKALWS